MEPIYYFLPVLQKGNDASLQALTKVLTSFDGVCMIPTLELAFAGVIISESSRIIAVETSIILKPYIEHPAINLGEFVDFNSGETIVIKSYFHENTGAFCKEWATINTKDLFSSKLLMKGSNSFGAYLSSNFHKLFEDKKIVLEDACNEVFGRFPEFAQKHWGEKARVLFGDKVIRNKGDCYIL